MRRRRKFLNSMVLVVILPSKNTTLYAPQAIFLKSMMLVVILPSKTSLFMRRRRKILHNHGTQTPSKLPKHPPKSRKHPPKYPKHPQNTPKPPNLRSEILLNGF